MRAQYFPITNGLYDLSPGLKPLGFDFGNADLDKKVFQLDEDFLAYRNCKLECRDEGLGKYFVHHNLGEKQKTGLIELLIKQLCAEWPTDFSWVADSRKLLCRRSGDELFLSPDGSLKEIRHKQPAPKTPVTDTLDAIALQVQEDLVLIQKEQNKDWLSFLHVCGPSHWAPEAKVGLSFQEVHAPIPGIERITRVSANLVDAMINKGPFVRFVWSFVTDTRLNHHPEAPKNFDPLLWKGRSFDATKKNPFSLRIERQVTYGIPAIDAALFTIRLSFIDGLAIKNNPDWNSQLVSALQSMTPESRIYKGLRESYDQLLGWLKDV